MKTINTIRYASSIVLCAVVTVLFTSCSTEIANPNSGPELGTLVNSGEQVRYVSIGNSLTAGYISGACFEAGQKNSYPSILARQLGAVDFVQPLYGGEGQYGGNGRQYLTGIDPATGRPVITTVPPGVAPVITSNDNTSKAFSNLGIPGAVLFDVLDTTDFTAKMVARKNPFFSSILRSQAKGKSILEQAASLQPNVMTCWIGSNDVLGYATSGGADPNLPEPTNPVAFEALYKQMVMAMNTNANLKNTKIILGTIPDVTSVPFFTYGNAYMKTTYGKIMPLVISTPGSANKVRQMDTTGKDLLLLPALTLLAKDPTYGQSLTKPIPSQYVLDMDELQKVKDATTAYNNTIKSIIGDNTWDPNKRFILFDAYTIFNEISASGYNAPGDMLTNTYISGGIFSLDGVHPTSRGYAIVANKLIDILNSKFGAHIKKVNPMDYPAIPFETVPN